MTPELNKTEGPTDGAEPAATQRIGTGAAEQPEATEPEGREPVLARFERPMCVPGMDVKGASRKSRAEPPRA